MGAPGASITDTNGKFHGRTNSYVVGPAVFPTLGSANPSLTAISLARRTANAIISAATPNPSVGFLPLSMAAADWQMVKQPSPASMIHYGSVMETSGWSGLYWYTKEQFTNFILSLDGASAGAKKTLECTSVSRHRMCQMHSKKPIPRATKYRSINAVSTQSRTRKAIR
jgi:GMC oxidoreductase